MELIREDITPILSYEIRQSIYQHIYDIVDIKPYRQISNGIYHELNNSIKPIGTQIKQSLKIYYDTSIKT